MKTTRVTRQSCSDGLHFGLHDGSRRRAVLLLLFFLFLDTIQNSGYIYLGKKIYESYGEDIDKHKRSNVFSNT